MTFEHLDDPTGVPPDGLRVERVRRRGRSLRTRRRAVAGVGAAIAVVSLATVGFAVHDNGDGRDVMAVGSVEEETTVPSTTIALGPVDLGTDTTAGPALPLESPVTSPTTTTLRPQPAVPKLDRSTYQLTADFAPASRIGGRTTGIIGEGGADRDGDGVTWTVDLVFQGLQPDQGYSLLLTHGPNFGYNPHYCEFLANGYGWGTCSMRFALKPDQFPDGGSLFAEGGGSALATGTFRDASGNEPGAWSTTTTSSSTTSSTAPTTTVPRSTTTSSTTTSTTAPA